ncbi:hypothetical protein ANCDUO_11292 [Ancylostoma duodenale]|uniref:Integrase catalytic domain-containing protein n=1 Tax=Ancylostoma duodenale TaxID=51022 RepID=A0A0C2D8L2_9BILA|nr:hypothetical protein ANCDUO_11292 [Ancylostoma duodenale]
MLHNSHYGQNGMLCLARSKIWFPVVDDAIERIANGCTICAALGKTFVRIPLHPWKNPGKVWRRLHVDFCETANGAKWLTVIDAKSSKWPELIKIGSTTAEKTAVKLKEVFSRHGLPEQLVSDNEPPFTSKECREYC